MSITRHPIPFPCLSRASVVSVSDGVVYSTRNGLARVTLSGVGIFTDPIFSKENWHAMDAAAIRCAYTGTRLMIFTETPRPTAYVLNVSDGGPMVIAYMSAPCAYADTSTGYAYFALHKAIYEFDSFDGVPMMQDWWSKEFVLPKPGNLGAVKIDFDEDYWAELQTVIAANKAEVQAANAAAMAATVTGLGALNANALNGVAVNGADLDDLPDDHISTTFLFYAGGVLRMQKTVTSHKGFHLPSGYKSDRFSFRVLANTKIQAVIVADTLSGLEQA